ncbi:MAG: translation initiation factor IF-2 [Deltaproteobacteria bacterium]|nr:MAG: translation initiation factor IF-2 [Deltaproteobacteria bacterium]
MSRVRVYELAREAGIAPKLMAEKLIDAGYDIKGHSSTVDAETADEIRVKLLKKTVDKKPAKKAEEAAGSVVPGRRIKVIRRRKKVQEAAEVKNEPAETKAKADLPESENSDLPDAEKHEPAAMPDVKDVPKEPESSPEDGEGPEEVQSAAADTAETGKAGAAESPEKFEEKSPDEHQPEKIPETPAEPEKKEKPKPPARKGIAKVVGVIELPVEEKRPPRARKKTARPGSNKRSLVADKVMEQMPVDPASGKGGRKKGKKGGYHDDEDSGRSRRSRSAKKGGKNVKFTHFGNDYQRTGKWGKKGKSKHSKSASAPAAEMKASKKRIVVYETISVSELASRMRVKASEVIAKLMGMGVMATINQAVDVETAMIVASEFGYEVEQGITEEIGIQMLDEAQEGGEAVPRSPVVTVMGHVDHGKTSILDAIRKTDVADGEAGGITQHIGAYHVRSKAGDITFVDTPGHAAFTEMRSRGAQITDLVILVVAADDGVMDQTREAIRHAQAADVPILVAVNKIDKDNADPDRVKRELAELNLAPEEWGGDTMFVETSAKKRLGIDDLMEAVMLLAEILELKADPDRKAKGRVVEAQLHKGRGAVATVLVQEGTLRTGDYFVVGQFSGKVRAMLDYKGRKVKEAGPSIPVEVQGIGGVPAAGDEFIVVTDEKMAKNVSQARTLKAREAELGANTKISLDKLFERMNEGEVLELKVVIRSDVQGTLEAFAKAAEELSTKEIKVRVLHEGTGTITESDILLASASEAIVLGFNVRPTLKVKELAQRENVDVRSYEVIYHALDDIKKAMVGMLEPTFEEEVIGTAEVRETFTVPKVGTIAGCFVSDGKIQRKAGVRVMRDGVVVYTGKISSLKRFKDDVKEVLTGFECGIGVENFNDIKVGDQLEAYIMLEVEATLDYGDE